MAKAFFACVLTLSVGALLAFAGSFNGITILQVPVFALCVGIAFSVQWAAFIPAYLLRTEKFYDLIGAMTYILLIGVALLFSPRIFSRSLFLSIFIIVWALRLGIFLFFRIRHVGSDRRFEAIKSSFANFLLAWTLQGLWVTFTLSAGLAAMTASTNVSLSFWDLPGVLLWILGFSIEVIADEQKRRFRKIPENKNHYISTGLWAFSRHPNYFGEILLWAGIALFAVPALNGWQYVTLLSPLFVYVLLSRISGIPILEERAKRTWGSDPSYQAYVDRTPILIMWPRKR